MVIEARRRENNADHEDHCEVERNVEDADMFSDVTSIRDSVTASTVKSRSTLKTRNTSRSKSSKNRRKAERKLYTTKEGSMYEDIGIIAAVHDIISSVPVIRDELGQVIRVLVEIDQEDLVSHTQNSLEELLTYIDKICPVVWKPEDKDKEELDTFGPEATVEDIIKGKVAKQEYSPPMNLLPPNLRYPPVIKKDNNWKLEIYS